MQDPMNGDCRRKRFRSGEAVKGDAMSQRSASINVSQSFRNLLNAVVNSTPKILVFLIVLVIGWIVAKGRADAMHVSRHARQERTAQQPTCTTASAGATNFAAAGSTGSTGPARTAGYSQDLGSTEGYSRGTDPADWRNPDANYW
jgi:Conserved TM helix